MIQGRKRKVSICQSTGRFCKVNPLKKKIFSYVKNIFEGKMIKTQ